MKLRRDDILYVTIYDSLPMFNGAGHKIYNYINLCVRIISVDKLIRFNPMLFIRRSIYSHIWNILNNNLK